MGPDDPLFQPRRGRPGMGIPGQPGPGIRWDPIAPEGIPVSSLYLLPSNLFELDYLLHRGMGSDAISISDRALDCTWSGKQLRLLHPGKRLRKVACCVARACAYSGVLGGHGG